MDMLSAKRGVGVTLWVAPNPISFGFWIFLHPNLIDADCALDRILFTCYLSD